MKLIVATLLLAALALGAKLAVRHLAPEKVASASVSDTANEAGAPDGTVQTVRITGLRASSFADLRTRAGAPLDRAALDADRLQLVRELAADGYLDATVDEPRVHAAASGISVELPVVPGPRYLLRDVVVEGRQLVGHPDLGAVPTLRAGQLAVTSRIDASVDALRTWLADRHSTASVGVRLEIDRDSKEVDAIFTAD